MKKVLFVCMGNICRSPTGEGIFRKLVEDRGLLDDVHVDSAGTIGYHAGASADRRMQQAASARGYSLESISRQVTAGDLTHFDLVIAMDRENLQDLQRLGSENRDASNVRLLSDFLGDHWPSDVPDPYYGGASGFDYVVEMIEEACPPILEELLAAGDGKSA